MKDPKSQIWDEIKSIVLIHHVVDWFGVGELEAFEMLDEHDLFSWFDTIDEARDFLGFIKN